MKQIGIAVIEYGKVGRVCGELLLSSDDLAQAGIIRRQESLAHPLPDVFHGIPVAAQNSELRKEHSNDTSMSRLNRGPIRTV